MNVSWIGTPLARKASLRHDDRSRKNSFDDYSKGSIRAPGTDVNRELNPPTLLRPSLTIQYP
jgi:hypothetical protein